MGRGTHGITGLPWTGSNVEDAMSATIDATDILGGRTFRAIAAATLKIGDAVYWSASRTVDKLPTATTNHYKVAGVVVSGKAFDYEIPHDRTLVGTTAALVNETVVVCFSGLVYVVCDAAIAVGVPIAPSTTVAGRVRPATALVAAAPGIGSLAVSGAPGIGTLDATVDSGSTPVTSGAANGAIATVTGAPDIGTLAVSGAPAAPALSGDGLFVQFGKMVEASSNAADVRVALINV